MLAPRRRRASRGALLCALVAALLALPSAASAATVKPPLTFEVLTALTFPAAGDRDPATGRYELIEICERARVVHWPLVPDATRVWMVIKPKNGPVRRVPSSQNAAPLIGRTADDMVRSADKGMAMVVLHRVQGVGCEEADRKLADWQAENKVHFEVETEARLIQGTVELDCAKEPSCPRANGIQGATVRAGRSKATTGPGGHYMMKVKKGVHQVRADAGALEAATRPQRVDLRKRKSAKASFKACGINGPAGLRAVGGGTWKGGNESCLNYFEITWRGSANALSINWVSAPRCATGIGKPKVMVKGGVVNPAQAGHNLIAGEDKVSFMYPLGAPQVPNNVYGELRADGTGTVTANAHAGQCTYGISNLSIKRG
jgi:hypothetical protein